MDKTIEEIHRELSQKIAKLEKERLEILFKAEKEQAELKLIEENERNARIIKLREQEEQHRKRKEQQRKEEIQRQIKENEMRSILEQKQNLVNEDLRVQKEKAEKLEREIDKAKFIEEQVRKALEIVKAPLVFSPADAEIILEESKTGESVLGTEGVTPDNPEMSQHLRSILRQNQRTY